MSSPCPAYFELIFHWQKSLRMTHSSIFLFQGSCSCQAVLTILTVSILMCLREVEQKLIFCDLEFCNLYSGMHSVYLGNTLLFLNSSVLNLCHLLGLNDFLDYICLKTELTTEDKKIVDSFRNKYIEFMEYQSCWRSLFDPWGHNHSEVKQLARSCPCSCLPIIVMEFKIPKLRSIMFSSNSQLLIPALK